MWLFTFFQQKWEIFILGFYFTCKMEKILARVKTLFPFHLFRERKKNDKWLINDCLHLLFLQSCTLSSFLPSICPCSHPSVCLSMYSSTSSSIHSSINNYSTPTEVTERLADLGFFFFSWGYSTMPMVRRMANKITSRGELPSWSYSL